MKRCFIEMNLRSKKSLLERSEPVKKTYLRANHSKFVNKGLSKAMMLRTKLRNKFLKKKQQQKLDPLTTNKQIFG